MATAAVPLCLIDTPLAAGDQWVIEVSLPGYSAADGWTAQLYLVGPTLLDVTGVGDGTDWTFTAASATTATKAAGRYAVAIKVTLAGESTTLPALSITVTPNIAIATANAFIEHADRMIPLLEAALEKRARIDMKAYQITNTQATREELADYLTMLDRYRAEVAGRDARSSGRMWRSHSAVL